MFSPDLYLKALHFAANAHGIQRTPKGHPYVVHVTSVAMELCAAFRVESGRDENLGVACALLHDVVEDTGSPVIAVEREFGAAVAAGVAALTKNAALPKPEAMADSVERILKQPVEIAMVKLADRITNLQSPPERWTAGKIQSYRAEAEMILLRLGPASAALSARMRERLAVYPR